MKKYKNIIACSIVYIFIRWMEIGRHIENKPYYIRHMFMMVRKNGFSVNLVDISSFILLNCIIFLIASEIIDDLCQNASIIFTRKPNKYRILNKFTKLFFLRFLVWWEAMNLIFLVLAGEIDFSFKLNELIDYLSFFIYGLSLFFFCLLVSISKYMDKLFIIFIFTIIAILCVNYGDISNPFSNIIYFAENEEEINETASVGIILTNIIIMLLILLVDIKISERKDFY